MPSIPSTLAEESVLTKIQLYRPGPFLQALMAWIRSQRIPPIPETSLGA